ncbi:hypothetical protein U1Q18_007205, partial [Sarracenia purpurea var. burkii]
MEIFQNAWGFVVLRHRWHVAFEQGPYGRTTWVGLRGRSLERAICIELDSSVATFTSWVESGLSLVSELSRFGMSLRN